MALSFFRFTTGALPRALDAARAATEAYRAVEAPSELSWSLTQQGYCLYLLGRGDESRAAVAEAVAVARAQGDAFRLAGALNAFALTIPPERAAERLAPLEEAVRCYREVGVESAIVPLANLAEAHYASGDVAAALARGLEVVAIVRRERDGANLAGALTNVAAYALTLGDLAQARAAAREALELGRGLGKTLNAMCALQHLGSVRAREGEPVRAARLLGASNALYQEFGLAREFTEQSLYDGTIALLGPALGEDALRRHLAAGAALPLAAALEEALAERAERRAGENPAR
jgi:tetratricopeptide (TPR) repeat protein